jgi:hypothetical protein
MQRLLSNFSKGAIARLCRQGTCLTTSIHRELNGNRRRGWGCCIARRRNRDRVTPCLCARRTGRRRGTTTAGAAATRKRQHRSGRQILHAPALQNGGAGSRSSRSPPLSTPASGDRPILLLPASDPPTGYDCPSRIVQPRIDPFRKYPANS